MRAPLGGAVRNPRACAAERNVHAQARSWGVQQVYAPRPICITHHMFVLANQKNANFFRDVILQDRKTTTEKKQKGKRHVRDVMFATSL